MNEYIHPNGHTYTEDELISAAKDENMTLEELINNRGIKPKKPGKQKSVAKDDAVATVKSTASKSVKPSTVSQDNIWGETKTQPEFAENLQKAIQPKQKAVVNKDIATAKDYEGNKNPLTIQKNWYKKENPSWWESDVKDEDEAQVDLQNLLNSRNKNNKDFTVEIPFAPGENVLRVKSNKTGNPFDYSWGEESEGQAYQDKHNTDFNDFVLKNSAYNKNKKAEETYKNYGFNEKETLDAVDNGALDWWGIVKTGVKSAFNRTLGDTEKANEGLGEIVRLTNKSKNAIPLSDPNDPIDVKLEKARSVFSVVKPEVGKAVQKDIDTNPIFKEKPLAEVIKTPEDLQDYLDNFLIKNRGFVDKTGLSDNAIKKFAKDHLIDVNNEQNLEWTKKVSESLKTKDLGTNVNFYKKQATKSFNLDELRIYQANENAYSLQESLYKLENDPKAKTDPEFSKKLNNLQLQVAAAKDFSNKLSAQGDDYNRYLYNASTSKLAKSKDGKIDLNNATTSDITDKVAGFSKIWGGTTRENLAKQFTKINSELETSNIEGNKKQNVLIPKDKVNNFISLLSNSGKYNGKTLSNGDVVLLGVPNNSLVGLTDQTLGRNQNKIEETFGLSEKGTGSVDLYSYDINAGKKGKKIDAELMDWKNRNIDLKANSIAINKLFLLNQSPTKEVPGFFHSVADGFTKAINPEYTTSREKVEKQTQQLEDANFKLSTNVKKELISSFKEDVGAAAGGGIPVVAKIAAATALTEGAAIGILGEEAILSFKAMKASASLTERAFYHATSALVEEGKMRAIGMGPTAGATFYGMGQILPANFKILNAYKYRAINNVTNLMGHALNGGISMEAAGITETAYHAITQNADFKDYLNTEFNSFSQVSRRVIGNSLAFSYMGAPSMFSGNFFKSGRQLESALVESNIKVETATQAIQQFKNNNSPKSDGYKEKLNNLTKDLDTASGAQQVLEKAHRSYMYDKSLETPDGLENYIIKENAGFINKYKEQYGHDLNIKVVEGKGTSSFEPPKFNEDGSLKENPTVIINKDQVFKGGFVNMGMIGHELAHFSDYVEIEAKANEYANSKIIKDGKEVTPSKEDVDLYKQKLEANKNKRIVDILVKNFPELMDSKEYNIKDTDTGLIKKASLVEAVTNAYTKRDVTGKTINPAEIQDEIIKRVIEELGKGTKLKNPLKERSLFRNLLNDFNQLISKGKKIDYDVRSADQLLNLMNDYAQSFKMGKGASYEHSEALAKVDLSNFTDMEFVNADLNDAVAIEKYDKLVDLKDKAINEYNNKSKESKNIEEEIDKLEDALAIGDIDQDTFDRRLAALEKEEQELKTKTKEQIISKPEIKKTEKIITIDEKKLGNEIDSFVGPKNASGKYEMTKEEWDNGGILKAKEKLIDGKMLEPLIRKELTRHGVTAENVHGINIDIFIEDVKDRLLEATLLKFNPEINDSLGGFVLGSQFGLKNKIGDVANKYKKQLSTSSIDVEAGGVGSIKELMSSEEADFEFEPEVQQGYKPKFKSLTDAKIVDKEVLTSIKNKIIPTIRTLKNRVDLKTSINRSIEPIVKEIINEMGSQADIDLKTAMGGKKDNQLRNWLIKNKKATLENITTTWAMGKSTATEVLGGIPEAVQKRVNGEWLSYPEYIGKKIDRTATTTDNKGNTSGDLMVRRTPDVANSVSDQTFLDRIIDPTTGNPWRGAKESLVKELSAQISLEAWRDDVLSGMEKYHDILELEDINPEKRTIDQNRKIEELNNQIKEKNPIFDAFRKNQEALGVVMADVQQSEIIKQFEQGNKKQSKDLEEAINTVTKNIIKDIENETPEKQRELIENWYLSHERSIRTYGYFEDASIKTNKGFWENIFEPILPEHLKDEKTGWALKEIGGIPKQGKERKSIITYKGLPSERFLNIITTKKDFGKNRTRIEKDSEKAREIYIDLINYYKGKPDGIAQFKQVAKLIKLDQTGLIRKMPTPGLEVTGLTKEENWLEHDPPVYEQIGKTLDYMEDKLSEDQFKSYLGTIKQNIISRKLDNILPKNSKMGNRMENSEFLLGLNEYVKKGEVNNLESIYGSKANFDSLVALAESKVISKQNKQNSLNIDVVTESSSDKYPDKIKKIRVFDFDDTLGKTSNKVLYTMPDGTVGKLNGAEFAEKAGLLANDGAIFDFSDFAKVREGKPGPLLSVAKMISEKRGTSDIFVLTARPADAAEPIQEFLRTFGLDIPIENITGLGDSRAQAKADWITQKASEGYNDFYFADDHLPNVKSVKDALDVLDVKGRVQQAKSKFSKNISIDFNKIIEENKGVENYKVFSDIVAKRRGAGKNLFDVYVPASAADFELLLYNFLGKGSIGETQKKFFSDALLKPYANGNDLMDAARQSIKKDYKALTNAFPNIKKKIEKLTPDGDFTYDQAIRVAMWKEAGIEIPGLSQRDATKLTTLVNNDPELSAFKAGLITMGRQGPGWITPTQHWDADTIIADLHNITEGAGRKKFLAEFIENSEEMFGKFENGKLVGANINKVEAIYGTNVREAIEDVLYRMINGKNRGFGQDKETTAWSNWVNGSTGAIMFLNTRSAALQLIGAVNFLNLRDNNPVAAGAAFANQKQYWKDFTRIWNSDKMKERRGGLKEDVASAEIANAAATSKNKPAAVIAYLLKIGYTPTQMADSFAIASGGAPFYRNRIKSYLKEGLTEQEAETVAWNDFTKVSDETQQSGDPRDISKQQASGAGRLLLTFQNTAMQQSRIVKKSYLDLKAGRGNAKTHVSKIIYYLGIQNALFSALQQGLFAVAFDDDDKELDPEKDKEKKKTTNERLVGVADGVLDTVLRGTGFAGGVVSVLKNMIKKYLDEKDKNFKADYAKVILEGANISPPIGSKLRKVYTGLQQTKFEKDLITERGWGVMQDGRVHLGPMYGVTGKLVEAGTNLPMDRLVNKIENVSQALNSQNQAWQRVAVGVGFTPYSVGIEDTKGDEEIRAKAKEFRKEEGKINAKETREKKKDSISKLPLREQVKLEMAKQLKRAKRKMGGD